MMLNDLSLWLKKLKDGSDLAHNFYFANKSRLPKHINKIFFVGMGGSGIAGRIIKVFLDKKTNIQSFVLDSCELPNFADADSLAIVVSYSGNTWETVEVLDALAKKFIPTIVLSHGGRISEIAESKNMPFILLPESVQSRAALGNFLGILLNLLDLMGIFKGKDIYEIFCKQAELYIPKFTEESYFKDFLDQAQKYEFFHILGVSGDSAPFAYRAQTQFNENSKVQAVNSNIPECCHNLLVGFTNCHEKPLVIMAYSDFLTSKLMISVTATTEILQEAGVLLYKMPVLGDNWEGQLFHMILWSDFASYFLGIRRKVEVEAVHLIKKLKEKHVRLGIK